MLAILTLLFLSMHILPKLCPVTDVTLRWNGDSFTTIGTVQGSSNKQWDFSIHVNVFIIYTAYLGLLGGIIFGADQNLSKLSTQ